MGTHVRLGALPSAWTLEGHEFVASAMHHKAADWRRESERPRGTGNQKERDPDRENTSEAQTLPQRVQRGVNQRRDWQVDIQDRNRIGASQRELQSTEGPARHRDRQTQRQKQRQEGGERERQTHRETRTPLMDTGHRGRGESQKDAGRERGERKPTEESWTEQRAATRAGVSLGAPLRPPPP